MKFYAKNFCYIFFLLLVVQITLAQNIVVFRANDETVNPALNSSLFIDESAQLTIQKILSPAYQTQFQLNTKKVPILPNTEAAIWFKFTLQNLSELNHLVFETDRAFTDSLSFFVIDSANRVVSASHGGLLVKFDSKEYRSNYNLFDINIPQNSTRTIYMRLHSNKSLQLPMQINTPKYTLEVYGMRRIMQGLFFGFVIALILYNIFLSITTKEITFVWYVVYATVATFIVANLQGFTHEFITANIPSWNKRLHVFYCLSGISYSLFCIEILNLRQYPIFKKIHQTSVVLFSCLTVVFLTVDNFTIWSFILRALITAVTITSLIIGFIIAYRGDRIARYYFIATSGLMIGAFLNALKDAGTLPFNTFTNYGVQFGIVWDVMLLSFAVGYKFRTLRKGKKEAEQATLQALEENNRLISEQNKLLEQKVNERTIELQEANEELKNQQEELLVVNEALEDQKKNVEAQKEKLEDTFSVLKATTDRMNANIRYAQEVQSVILPTDEELRGFFQDYFAIYLPKDVVSGDFYWFKDLGTHKPEPEVSITKSDLALLEELSQKLIFDVEETVVSEPPKTKKTKKEVQSTTIQTAIFVLADCTGHGVPGAFMSMIGNTLLHDIIVNDNITDPAKILKILHKAVTVVLRQHEGKNNDGMDISIVFLEKNTQKQSIKITFAGAKNSVYYLQNNELVRMAGDRFFIGGFHEKERIFSNKTVELKAGEMLYLASDGFIDQNNAARESIGVTQFKMALEQIHLLTPEQQKETLLTALVKHQGTETQRDDITVIGLKL
jgi:serine phosphatase RsbU (regulator of sigma subunit)